MAAPAEIAPAEMATAPPLTVLHAESAFEGDALARSLATHGYCVLRGLESSVDISGCDASFMALFTAPASVKARLHCRRSQLGTTTRARARRLKRKRLPLAGIGFSVVADKRGEATREQLHLVTDASTLALVPWPRGALHGLRGAAQCATAELHRLAVRLLATLDAGYEATRAAQAERLGDPSVLDAFLYPQRDAASLLMRSHADPGLLTLTLASDPAGLEVLDRASGRWTAVEALCACGDLIVLCGEALELVSGGRFCAAAHRVASAPRPRLSVVFELRLQEPRLQEPRAPARGDAAGPKAVRSAAAAAAGAAGAGAAGAGAAGAAAAGAGAATSDELAISDELEQARQYVAAFVAARRRAGASVAQVLDEFSVPRDSWPAEAEAASLAELATLVFCWARACTDMAHEQAEATAALATAEHVSITPSFADSTGRFVDVRLQRGAS